MNPIYPCLWFDGTAQEAARFYTHLFQDAQILNENPMVTSFEIFGRRIIGLNGGPNLKINASISLFVVIPDRNELDRLWTALLEGGEAIMPLGEYGWSQRYGWIKDRFGMSWQLMIGDERHERPALTPSLLFTGSQFGNAEAFIKIFTELYPGSSPGFIQYYPPGDDKEGKVLFSEFTLAQNSFIAMDGPGEHNMPFNEGVSFVVECQDQKEIDTYWDLITQTGEESMCGWCKDCFGIFWQIIPAQLGNWMEDPEHGKDTMNALLKMKKLVIEDLKLKK